MLSMPHGVRKFGLFLFGASMVAASLGSWRLPLITLVYVGCCIFIERTRGY